MTLTSPLTVTELRIVYPRDLLGVDDAQVMVLLEIEEAALRAQFGVISTTAAVNLVLRQAMIAGWPSFRIQVRQQASEDAGTEGYRIKLGSAADFTWPTFVAAILARVADDPANVDLAPTRSAISIPLDIRF